MFTSGKLSPHRWCAAGMVACLLVLAACGGSGGGVAGGDAGGLPDGDGPPPAEPVVELTVRPEAIKELVLSWTGVPPEATVTVQEDLDGQSGFASRLILPAGRTTARLPVFLPSRLGALYRLRICLGTDCRESEPVGLSEDLTAAAGYFKPESNATAAFFGASVAFSSSGTTMAVGALGAGKVEVFVLEGSAWRSEAVLSAPEGVPGRWGASVALSRDGNRLAVGAPGEQEAGQVVVLSRSNGVWAVSATLSGGESTSDGYGSAVALSAEGDYLAVGAPRTRRGQASVGAAYLYFDGPVPWYEVGRVMPSDLTSGAEFGASVALSAQGTALLVGEPGAHAGIGAARVYRVGAGTLNEEVELTGSQDQGPRRFGHSVAWAQGGGAVDRVAVGAPCSQRLFSPFCTGAVHVLSRPIGGEWAQEVELQAAVPRDKDRFGYSVSISGDGAVLAVGTPGDAGSASGIGLSSGEPSLTASGAVHVFRRGAVQWLLPAVLKAPNVDRLDEFGLAVALSANGQALAVGSPGEASAASGIGGAMDDNSLQEHGAVYLY